MKSASIVFLLIAAPALAGCTGASYGETVELHALTFENGDVTVSVGDKVTFVVVEASHTVDFAEGTASVSGVSDAHSGNLDPGAQFEVTFTAPGTYPYFCQYHSSVSGGERIGMIGTITVS